MGNESTNILGLFLFSIFSNSNLNLTAAIICLDLLRKCCEFGKIEKNCIHHCHISSEVNGIWGKLYIFFFVFFFQKKFNLFSTKIVCRPRNPVPSYTIYGESIFEYCQSGHWDHRLEKSRVHPDVKIK